MDKSSLLQENLTKQYFEDVVSPLLPNAECEDNTMWSTSNDKGNSWEVDYIEFSPYLINGSLYGSQYEYKKPLLKFIHYTSIDAAKSILESAKIRMYSLGSMNDEQELSFAIENIVPDKGEFYINGYKGDVFSLSMNEFQEEIELKKTWEEYGGNGKGVGMVISFPKETQKKWHQQYLSKIHYKIEKLEKLKKFYESHLDFKAINNLKSVRGSITNFILPLASFHKTKGFKNENEIRFINVNKDAYSEREINTIKYNGVKSYIELNLNEANLRKKIESVYNNDFGFADKALEGYPVPKIEKIIIGSKIKNFDKISLELKKSATANLGYNIKVEKSTILI